MSAPTGYIFTDRSELALFFNIRTRPGSSKTGVKSGGHPIDVTPPANAALSSSSKVDL